MFESTLISGIPCSWQRADVQEARHRSLPGARDPTDQGGLEHEAGRVGWSLQDRPGGQGQEGRQVLRGCAFNISRFRSATGVARDLRMMCCRTTSRPTSNLLPPRPTCSRESSKTSYEPCHDMSAGLRALKTETKTSDFELNQ